MNRLLEVKKEIGTLSKNSKNPFFKSAYLDLNSLLNAVEPLLHDHGLLLTQPIDGDKVFSIIIDAENGKHLAESCLIIPNNITDPQKIGSCITYFRRYTLKSLLAISEVDDDGNLASQKPRLNKDLLNDYLVKGDINQLRELIKNHNCTKEHIELITKRANEIKSQYINEAGKIQ